MSKHNRVKLILGFCGVIFFLVLCLPFCWWYGYYPEWGKPIRSLEKSEAYDLFLSVWENPDTHDLLYNTLEQEIPDMTTEVLVDFYVSWAKEIRIMDNPYYPCHLFEGILRDTPIDEMIETKDWQTLIIYALFERHNAGRILMKTYRDAPLIYNFIDYLGDEDTAANDGCIAYLEMILVQKEIQNHLTPWEKSDLIKLADEKQAEKFSEPGYPLASARYNYLYTDTYGYKYQDLFGEDYKEDFGWLEDKVREKAKSFKYLLDIEDPEALDGERKKIQEKNDQQEILNSSKENLKRRFSFRFDLCETLS